MKSESLNFLEPSELPQSYNGTVYNYNIIPVITVLFPKHAYPVYLTIISHFLPLPLQILSPAVPFTAVTKQHTLCHCCCVALSLCLPHCRLSLLHPPLSLSPSINSVPCCSLHSSNKAAHTVSLLLCCAVTVTFTLPSVVTAPTSLSLSLPL
jgi:hypothetical protein